MNLKLLVYGIVMLLVLSVMGHIGYTYHKLNEVETALALATKRNLTLEQSLQEHQQQTKRDQQTYNRLLNDLDQITRSYQVQQEALDRLRRSDDDVEKYLATPVPSALRMFHLGKDPTCSGPPAECTAPSVSPNPNP